MMFKLNNRSEKKGKSLPAGQVGIVEDYSWDSDFSVKKVKSAFPDFQPDLTYQLIAGYEFTDYIRQSAMRGKGMLVTEKFRDILGEYITFPHQYYSATVRSSKDPFEVRKYSLLSFDWDAGYKYIDFEKSTFKLKKLARVIGHNGFKSFEEFVAYKSDLEWDISLWPEKIVLNDESRPSIFTLPVNFRVYINEDLASRLKQEDLSGVEISPPESYLIP